MSKQQKKSLVPELRFPEFRDTREWQLLHGDKVFDQISNKDHNSDLPILAITQEYGAIPREEIDYHVSVTDKSIESYKVVGAGDFIISLRSFQGGIEYSNYKGLCSPAYVVLRKKIDVSNQFFKHFFKTNIFIQSMNKNIEGIRDGKMVSYKQFSELLLPYPLPDEQQKIADCLTFVDELITTQTQKLDALKTHKKGMMQQLFPAEGETEPKLRFPEFRDKGEWAVKKLSSLVQLISGLHLSPEQYSSEGTVPYFTGPSDFTDRIQQISKWTGELKSIAKENDTLITVKGSGVGEIWFLTLPRVAMGRQLMAVRSTKNSSRFIYQFLLTKRTRFEDLASGNLIPGLSRSDILDIESRFPSLPEQQKIADCLTSLDDLITAQAKKIETLKAHKKGLMQQLFPAMDEVNA